LAQPPQEASNNRLREVLTKAEGEKGLPEASIRLLLDAFSLYKGKQ
jgi:hypothetical protein